MIAEDCSSVATFKGVCHIIRETRPLAFILENVDSLETSGNNPDDEKGRLKQLILIRIAISPTLPMMI